MISFRFIVQCIFLFIGNVGPPLPCCEIKLADVEDMNYYAKDNKGEVHSNHTYDAVLGPIQENPPKCKGGGHFQEILSTYEAMKTVILTPIFTFT